MQFRQGDRVSVKFGDPPEQDVLASVSRILSDQQEGLSPEAEDYVAFWMELATDRDDGKAGLLIVTFGTDSQYYVDGRRVTLQKL